MFFNIERIDVKKWSNMSLSERRGIIENSRVFYLRAFVLAAFNLLIASGFLGCLIMATIVGHIGYVIPSIVMVILWFFTAVLTLSAAEGMLKTQIKRPPHSDDIKEFARLSRQEGELTQV